MLVFTARGAIPTASTSGIEHLFMHASSRIVCQRLRVQYEVALGSVSLSAEHGRHCFAPGCARR